jgi:hypothetical protein
MIRITSLAVLPALALAATLAMPAPALAHGNVTCNSGPESGWKSVDALKAKITRDGWTIAKAKPWKDCYEVYGTMADGKKVEAFFHPVTLEKVRILQRGKVIYPAS